MALSSEFTPPSHHGTLKKFVFFLVIPGLIATAVILKTFLVPDCLPFDSNDDANHTFVNLHVARSIMHDGEIPMINLFNNFGTPILGDTLTYPLAFHAITYMFFPAPTAMFINRWILAFLTVLLLTLYFKKYLSLSSSSISAVLVFLSPGFLWHFAHHQFQSSLLFFTLILLAQDAFVKRNSFLNLLYLYAGFVFLLLNTSINLVFFMLPFFVLNQYFIGGCKINRNFCLFILAMFCSAICMNWDLSSFFKLIPQSLRVDYHYGVPFTLKSLLLGVLGQPPFDSPWRHHTDLAIYFSIPVLMFVLIGLSVLFKNKMDTQAYRVIILGVLPTVAVLFLLWQREIWGNIPLLKAVDITRIWWVSNIFLMLAVGAGLDSIKNRSWKPGPFLAFVFIILSCIFCYKSFLNWDPIPSVYKAPVIFLFIFLLGYLILLILQKNKKPLFLNLFFSAFCIILIAAQVPSFLRITTLNDLKTCRIEERGDHYYSHNEEADFWPSTFLNKMTPYSRMATELMTIDGQDLRGTYGNILGSDGRSALLNKDLFVYLMEQNLIQVDRMPISYYFKRPWDTQKLDYLGIKYLIEKDQDPQLNKDGWRILANEETREGQLFLYENPNPVSIAYVQAKGNQKIGIQNIKFKGNGLSIAIPDKSQAKELFVSFVALQGWKAWVDGKETKIYSSGDPFIRIGLQPHNKMVYLRYAPISGWYILGCVIVSLLALIGAYFAQAFFIP